ncbi:MAG: arsenate reductase family protein [Planctomycetota bacterium]
MPTSNPNLTVYGYTKCDSCRKAIKWLDTAGLEHTFVDITKHPPTAATLAALLDGGRYELKHLFNTSGQLYRSMKIKDQLPTMSKNEALALLAANGMLIKRPILTDGTRHTLGFRPEVLAEVWG